MYSCIKMRILFFFLAMSINFVYGQIDSLQENPDTSFNLVGDTLFTNHDLKMFVGQKLIVGKGSEENELYKTIGFKSAASWPVWLWQDAETKINYEYQADPQKRINDKVKQYLSPGDTVIIKRIKRNSNKHTGHWYTAFLKTKGFPGISLRSNIVNAIRTKELLIIP